MVNAAYLIGNLGADPKLMCTQNGLTVANFNIATSENWTDKNGNKKTLTEWHRIVAFGKLGDICGQYLTRGTQVYIEGRIQTKQWNDQDGNKRYTTEIVAKQMRILTSKKHVADNNTVQKEHEDSWEEQEVEVWSDSDWADHLGCDEDEVDDFFESQMC